MFGTRAAITLPRALRQRVDAQTLDFLRPDRGPAFDFTGPSGEPALIPADSVTWRVFKNPTVVFIGGVSAVLLELAEPRVRDAIWTRSRFKSDPLARLRRTGLAAMVTVYGARSRAEEMIARVVEAHDRIAGCTSDGVPYQANDPELLDWVNATTSFGFLEAYSAYAQPLSSAGRDAFLREGQGSAFRYGATGAPGSAADLAALMEAIRPGLAPSPVIADFLSMMARLPVFPTPIRQFQPTFLRAAVDILPAGIRDGLALGNRFSLRSWERPLVRAMAAAGERIVLASSPAVQSCRRLGLPDDFLYR